MLFHSAPDTPKTHRVKGRKDREENKPKKGRSKTCPSSYEPSATNYHAEAS